MSSLPRDLDGVLFDAGNTILFMDYDLLSEWVGAAGVELSPDRVRRAEARARVEVSRFVGSGSSTEGQDTLEVYVRSLLTAATESPYDGAVERLLPIFGEPANLDLLWSQRPDGIEEALDRLRGAGLGLGVVSNADGTVDRKLAAIGLADRLDVIVDSGNLEWEKPDPRIFRHALELGGWAAERCLYVGDLYAVDVVGARQAGLHPVLVDPFGDWDVDCLTVRDVPELVARLV